MASLHVLISHSLCVDAYVAAIGSSNSLSQRVECTSPLARSYSGTASVGVKKNAGVLVEGPPIPTAGLCISTTSSFLPQVSLSPFWVQLRNILGVHAWFGPRKALPGGISKSILQRPCHFLAINAHKMAPRTT